MKGSSNGWMQGQRRHDGRERPSREYHVWLHNKLIRRLGGELTKKKSFDVTQGFDGSNEMHGCVVLYGCGWEQTKAE